MFSNIIKIFPTFYPIFNYSKHRSFPPVKFEIDIFDNTDVPI